MMLRHGVAFTPLFVCNEFATALHYAKCRAASDIDAKVDSSAVPAVFMLEVPSQHLSMDDYSEHEPGQWKIDVTCWMPADRQRTPFSCILDGLQASSGATLGKQNIRFNQSDDVLNGGWPVIHVVRLKDADRPTEGIAYRATGRFHELLKAVSPEHLEDGSRALAHEEVGSLFEIRPMSPLELMQAHRS